MEAKIILLQSGIRPCSRKQILSFTTPWHIIAVACRDVEVRQEVPYLLDVQPGGPHKLKQLQGVLQSWLQLVSVRVQHAQSPALVSRALQATTPLMRDKHNTACVGAGKHAFPRHCLRGGLTWQPRSCTLRITQPSSTHVGYRAGLCTLDLPVPASQTALHRDPWVSELSPDTTQTSPTTWHWPDRAGLLSCLSAVHALQKVHVPL